MKTYTLHVPRLARGGVPAMERAKVVADGFSWGAFAFTFLWCFRHRLWLAGTLVLLAFALLAGAGYLLHWLPVVEGLAAALLALLVGFEASSLRRWTYGRRGWPLVDAVCATDADEAEAKFLVRAAAPTGARATPQGRGFAPRADDPVFGLFPEAEGSR